MTPADDCDDDDANVYPLAPEICDGVVNDCYQRNAGITSESQLKKLINYFGVHSGSSTKSTGIDFSYSQGTGGFGPGDEVKWTFTNGSVTKTSDSSWGTFHWSSASPDTDPMLAYGYQGTASLEAICSNPNAKSGNTRTETATAKYTIMPSSNTCAMMLVERGWKTYIPPDDICDGIDNDCDGEVDEEIVCIDASFSDSYVAPQKAIRNKNTSTSLAVWTEAESDKQYNLTFKVEPVLQSGWHVHNQQNDGREQKVGTLSSYKTILTKNNPLAVLTYTSGEVSGKEKVKIFVDNNQSPAKELTIDVKVPNLTPLPTGGSLITYTSSSAGKRHALESSNYGTAFAVISVLDAVNAYAHAFGLDGDVNLAAIDMSLPWGGIFDYKNDWSSPHKEHREGTMVDFSSYYRDDNGNVTNISIWRDGVFVGETSVIDDDALDAYFTNLISNRCSRAEKDIGLIHYNCQK